MTFEKAFVRLRNSTNTSGRYKEKSPINNKTNYRASPTVGLQQKVPDLLMRGTQHLTHPILHDFEGVRSHNPTKLLRLT